MHTLTFPITREQLEAKRGEASAHGLMLEGDASDATVHTALGDVRLGFSYDGANLAVTILHKPVLLSEGAIESKLREMLA